MLSLAAFVLAPFLLPTPRAAAGPLAAEELRGLELGVKRGKVKGLQSQGSRDGLAFFTRGGERGSYRGMPVDRVLYGFSGGKLARIELQTAKLGPSPTFGCEDHASSQNKLWAALAPNFTYDHTTSTLTSSPNDHRMLPLLEVCKHHDAYDCSEVVGIRAPQGDGPDARELVAKVRGVMWVRQRTRADLTPAEQDAIAVWQKTGGPTPNIPLDEYRCQFTVELTAGRSRQEMAAEQERWEQLNRDLFGE